MNPQSIGHDESSVASFGTESTTEPLVSVVMPCYHEPLDILGRTIDSILAQTHGNLEFIIVVDDPNRAELSSYLNDRALGDERIRVCPNEKNLGVWPSYSQGVRQARGQYLAIQDADDVSMPSRIEKLVAFLVAHPDVDVVGCALEYVNADTGESLMIRTYPSDVTKEIRRRCPVAHATTVHRAGLYEANGFYDESPEYRHAADYELWCRWLVKGVRIANIPDSLYLYYQSDQNFKAQNVTSILKDTITIKRKYADALGFGAMDRLYLFAEWVASQLPSKAIVAIFYAMSRSRARASLRDPA